MEGLRRQGSTSRGRSLGDASALLESISREVSSPPPPLLPGMEALGERRASEMLSKGLSALEMDTQELEQQITSVYSGIFKLFTTHASPNYAMPWSKLAQSSSIGTGFAIDKKRKRYVCTCAQSQSYPPACLLASTPNHTPHTASSPTPTASSTPSWSRSRSAATPRSTSPR